MPVVLLNCNITVLYKKQNPPYMYISLRNVQPTQLSNFRTNRRLLCQSELIHEANKLYSENVYEISYRKSVCFYSLTCRIRCPCMPSGSWLMEMMCWFVRRSLASLETVLRSVDISRGDAMIAHSAICTRDCSILKP